jgi:hypothetical protein
VNFSSFLFYLFFDDYKPNIEYYLKCKVSRSNYTESYIEYKISSTLDDKCIRQLEDTIKHHVEVIYKDFRYKVRVYHELLSAKCDFRTVKSKELVLGEGYDGLVTIPLNEETNNYLIVGASGSGKSSLAVSVIKNLKDNGVEVWISDNKGSHDYDFLNLPLTKNVYEFIGMLDRFEIEVERRLNEDKQHKPLLYVIDEVFPISCLESKLKKNIFNRLALIMSRCRSANCHIMIISQRSTTDIIDPRLMANISNRICLATSSQQESINVLGDDSAFRIETIGRGILSINGRFTEFQSFYFKKTKSDSLQQTQPTTIKVDTIQDERIPIGTETKILSKKLG